MSYHRSTNSASGHATPSNVHRTSENKENVPLHSQIFQRLTGSANARIKANEKKEGRSHNYFNQVQSPSTNIIKSLSPRTFSFFPLSRAFVKAEVASQNVTTHLEPETVEENGLMSDQNTHKDLENMHKEAKLEDQKHQTDREITPKFDNSVGQESSRTPEENPTEERNASQIHNEFHHTSVKSEDLNDRFRHLDKKINIMDYSLKDEGTRTNCLLENGVGQLKEQMKNNKELLKSKRFAKANEREKSAGSSHKKSVYKTQLAEGTNKKKKNISKEEELWIREKNLKEGEKIFEANEKAFETLTKKLEEQSEELAKQKLDYSKKVETFNASVQKFEKEKEEFAANCNAKSMELMADDRRLQNIRKEIQIEQAIAEEKCREILKGYADLDFKRKILEKKDEELMRREKLLRNDSDNLLKEKLNFSKKFEFTEKSFKDKERDLSQREHALEVRKNALDDFDLKLLSMKLNEEVWQKKRDMEVLSLQERIKLTRTKESELQKKEEKLNKMLKEIKREKESSIKAEFDMRDTKASERATTHNDSLANDKTFGGFTSRTANNEEVVEEDTDIKNNMQNQ